MSLSDAEQLAELLHGESCLNADGCIRWRDGSEHQRWYLERARSIITQLEPEIGMANVFLAVRVILEEVG